MDEAEEQKDRAEYDYSNLWQWMEAVFAVAVNDSVDAAQQQIEFRCARCRESWFCPSLSVEQRREIADLVRAKKTLFEQLEFLRLAGFTFSAAKRTLHHIVNVPGKCQRCSRELPDDSEQVVCRCRSLNLNW